MHLQEIFRLRRHFTLLLLCAGAICISAAAQARQTAPGDALRIQPDNMFAGILDNEDCFDDYAGQPVQGGSVAAAALAPAATAGKAAPAGIASQADKPALSAARPQTPAVAPVAIAPAAAPPAPAWEIAMTDKTLNGALARWTTLAGWQLRWELPVDYAVEAQTSVPGTFVEAVETVARSMGTAEVPMTAIFYRGNKVLRIVPKGGK